MPTVTPSTPTSRAGRNLPAAIGVGVALFAAIAVGLFVAPWFFVLLVATGLAAGVVEVARAFGLKGARPATRVIAAGTFLTVVGGYIVTLRDVGVAPMTFVVMCVVATLLGAFVARLLRGPDGFLRDAGASAFLVGYLPLMGVFISVLMGEHLGNMRILTIICCVIASDTGAYAVGSLIGRHKMAPHISPSKTWEGLAGALALAGVVGALFAPWLLDAAWWQGLLLGIALGIGGTVGDLLESLIKRDAGIKDMSNFLPGHGGIMDRLDSMLVAVPIGWFILHAFLGS